MNTAALKAQRLRRAILELICSNHDRQQSRIDASALWSFLVRGLRFDVGRNEVFTMLQDLCGRGYLSYQETKDRDTNQVMIWQIELTPRGRDVLEGTIIDPAVGD